MSTPQRLGLLLAAVLVLVVAFVVLSGDDDEDTTADTVPAQVAPTTTTRAPEPEPEPEVPAIRVRNGQPVGGVRTIEVERGDRARFVIRSQDTTDEVHLHGYDIERQLQPGAPARFSFRADSEGIFELELHGDGTQVAELRVVPG